ncbi:MAG: hypothetical protein JNG90_14765, partial [Planctomycetaceae bacterium]|nr:hypothetical protein [Planctomycetaceae bacterium]
TGSAAGRPPASSPSGGSGTKLPAKRGGDEDIELADLSEGATAAKTPPGTPATAAQPPKGPAPQVSLAPAGPSPYDLVKRAAEIDIKAPGPTLLPVEEKQQPLNLLPLYLTLGAVGVVVIVIAALILLS